ncbi:vacuolar fusion protein MON1 homolog A [Ciona intestinalis]
MSSEDTAELLINDGETRNVLPAIDTAAIYDVGFDSQNSDAEDSLLNADRVKKSHSTNSLNQSASDDASFSSTLSVSMIGEPTEEEITIRQRHLSLLVADEEEYINSSSWRDQKRHFFVLTEAGKPVYSRHGSEDKLSSVMGVMLALVSCVHDRNDKIRSITAGDHKFVFLIKIPLILVAVCSTPESITQITVYLKYIYNKIVSVLTLKQLDRIYAKQKNFDLRRLLTGTDKFLDHLCTSMDTGPEYLLGAFQCLPLAGNIRDLVSQALQLSKTNDLAFALLLTSGKTVSYCRLREHNLHSSDLQILINLITASSSFHAGENWLPICLPHFNPQGYLHAHISYLDDDFQTCLLLLSADVNSFFTLSEAKKKVMVKLNKHDCLPILKLASEKGMYNVSKIGLPDLRHFIYKSKHQSQFTAPEFISPYHDVHQQERLFGLYQHLHGKIHNPAIPLKLLFEVSDEETMLAWVASGFELYVAFSPLVTKGQAISSVDRLLRWIKQREDELFMIRPLVF